MKKFIRLTESELKEIIKMVINEQATPEPPYSLSSPKTPLPKSLPLPKVLPSDTTDTFYGEATSVTAEIAIQMATAYARIKYKQKMFNKYGRNIPPFMVAAQDVEKIDDKNYRAIVSVKMKS